MVAKWDTIVQNGSNKAYIDFKYRNMNLQNVKNIFQPSI